MRRRRAADGAGSLRHGDVPALRRARPGDEQPAGAADRASSAASPLVLFAILFFRLWFLQILDGDEYLAEAKNNRTREYPGQRPARRDPRPRGRTSWSTTAPAWRCRSTRASCPTTRSSDGPSWRGWRDLTHSTLRRVRRTMHEELKLAPAAPVTLRRDVGDYLVYYLQENQDAFPGVEVQRVFVRDYPNGTLAAHILGNVGEISEERAEGARYQRPASPATRSARTASRTPTTASCAAPGPDQDPGRRDGSADPGRPLVSQPPVPGRQPAS